ncbi:MAG: zinc ribbon domain-containing protein [Dehalococcoidia bacterium]
MPRYDYRCDSCGKTYELIQSFSAESTHTCEKCGNGTARRLLSAPPIVFKGSGWYVTDSRNGRSATSSPATTGDGSTPESTPAKAEESAAS